MKSGRRIFISAVTNELKSARQLVATTLQIEHLGYKPTWVDIFGTEQGEVRSMLRRKIDSCFGVIQLVGECYGFEPHAADEQFGRVSYTQYEAEYARHRGKPVWYLVIDPGFPTDPHEPEPQELQLLQARYRQRISTSGSLYHVVHTDEALQNRVLQFPGSLRAAGRAVQLWKIIQVLLLVAILAVGVWIAWRITHPPDGIPSTKKLFAVAGEWARDQFLAVRVAQPATGTLLGDKPYEVSLDVRNLTTMQMIITRTVVLSRNAEAAALLGTDNPQVFTAEIHVSEFFDGNATNTIPVRLNQVLPKEITVQLYHNHSDAPSEFRIDLGGKTVPMPAARYLRRSQVYSGYGSELALRQAIQRARAWGADAEIVAEFPGKDTVFIDEGSRLKYLAAESWVVTFYSALRNRIFSVIVSASGVQTAEAGKPPEAGEDLHTVGTEPVLSFQQAVDIANRSSLLSADWQTTRLGVVDVGGAPAFAWMLPYRAPTGLPIAIDAVTGDQLVPQKGGLRRVTLHPVPASR